MDRCRLLYLMIEDYLDSSWRSRPWSLRSVHHFRWFLLGLYCLFRGVLYQLMLHLSPTLVVNNGLHLAVTYSNVNASIYFAVLTAIAYCTLIQYILSATFDQPLQWWEIINTGFYCFENLYLQNFNAQSPMNLGKIRRWLNSYRDEEIIWKTSVDYIHAHHGKIHLFKAHLSSCIIVLKKINNFEFGFFILATFFDVLYACFAIIAAIVILPTMLSSTFERAALEVLTLGPLALLTPHMCFCVVSFLIIMSYLVLFAVKHHLTYVYTRLKDFSHRKRKLLKVINYAQTELVLATGCFMKINKENAQFLLAVVLLINFPTNMFLLNNLLLVDMDPIPQIITINIIVVQLVGMLIVSLSVASASKAVHARAPMLVRVQGRVARVNVRTKLTVMRMFEMLHTDKIISISLGPIEKVNYNCVFQLFTFYIAQFLLVQQFIRRFLF